MLVWDLAAVVGWVGLLAGVGTLGARLAYANYYGALGIAPDEVDLSPSRLVVFTGVIAVAVSSLAAIAAAIGGYCSARWQRNQLLPGIVVSAAVGEVALLVFGHLPAWLTITPSLLLGLTLLVLLPLRLPDHLPPWWRTARRWATSAAGGTVVILWIVAYVGADAAARADRTAGWLGRHHSLTASLIVPEARRVCLRPIAGAGSFLPPSGVLLGSVNGIDVLVDDGGRVWRFSASAVALVEHGPTRC